MEQRQDVQILYEEEYPVLGKDGEKEMKKTDEKKLKKIFAREGIDALFITKGANQRYLEGFTGADCFLIASPMKNFIIADSRYTEMAADECQTAEVVPHRPPYPLLAEVVTIIAHDNGFFRLGFEKDRMTWGMYDGIRLAAEAYGVELIPTVSVIEALRAIKTPEEADKIQDSCRIADRALDELLPLIKPGVSELDLKIELDYRLKKLGAEDVSFDTMVLFGARASQPHANSRGDARLREGDFILLDYGACKDGYRSDTSRTFVCGKASIEQKLAYGAVLKSQIASLEMVSSGANGRDINNLALGIIRRDGFSPFEYGIGHGVGLEIHETPFLRQNTDVILEEGMIVTIEPGTYKPGWGGIRIEDTVLVKDGRRVLTRFPKELMEL
jgi:Xaa-Pro aminopeptidase